jgi:hypothetical protein
MQVVIGLVEYTQDVYPVQGSYINTFDANTYVQKTVAADITDGIETTPIDDMGNPDTIL